MAGRHRTGRSVQQLVAAWRRRTIEMVDAGTHTAHVLTEAAVAAGRRGGGRYFALCGVEVRPASLTLAEDRRCLPCSSRRLGWLG